LLEKHQSVAIYKTASQLAFTTKNIRDNNRS